VGLSGGGFGARDLTAYGEVRSGGSIREETDVSERLEVLLLAGFGVIIKTVPHNNRDCGHHCEALRHLNRFHL